MSNNTFVHQRSKALVREIRMLANLTFVVIAYQRFRRQLLTDAPVLGSCLLVSQ